MRPRFFYSPAVANGPVQHRNDDRAVIFPNIAAAWTGLLVLSLIPCLGCLGRSEAIQKVIEQQSIVFGVTLSSHAEVVQVHRENSMALLAETQRICELLESIHDSDSAMAAVQNYRTQEVNYVQKPPVKKQLYIEMDDNEFLRLLEEIKGIRESAEAQAKGLFEREKAAIGRINNEPNINFTARMSVNRTILSRNRYWDQLNAAIESIASINRRYPPELRVTVVMNRIKGCHAMNLYLSDKVKAKSLYGADIDSYYAIVLSPISDLRALSQLIDIGSIANIDPFNRIIEIRLSENDSNQLVAIEEKQLKKALDEQNAFVQKQAEKNQQQDLEQASRYKQQAIDAQKEREQALTKIVACLQQINSVPSFEDQIQIVKSEASNFKRTERTISQAKTEYQKNAKEALELESQESELISKIGVEVERLKQDHKLRALLAKEFGKDADTTQLLSGSAPTRGFSNPAEDPKHPDFFAANLVDLLSSRSYNRQQTLERLKNIDPNDVEDVSLRKEITRTIRDIAINSRGFDQPLAAECLCQWAGTYSIPYLGEMLRKTSSSMDQSILINLLARFPCHESASEICQMVGERSVNDEACIALVKIGSAAEDAVLEITPVADPLQCLSGVRILGEIGTKKSLPLLQKARASTNRDVRDAARESTRKISARENIEPAADESKIK